MRWTELRGLLAFAAMVALIAYVWQEIENRELETADSQSELAAADDDIFVTGDTALATTTTFRYNAVLAMCDRTDRFVAETELIPADSTPGPLATLALDFWNDVVDLGPADLAGAFSAAGSYYQDYLATGEPFDFDLVDIILEGDKERYEQLITRPAAGLESARESIRLLCGVEVADQPSMSSRSFNDLEDRLLFPDRSNS